ncbi:MAG TPA: proteasome subunit beta [Candidatus Nanoarchaeia archaeon]|nr:proteasome subunit beta [Candidatus Nanoarchaeia archaeon]
MEQMQTGTTTVGIVCKDGLVLAADKRVTAGYLIANKKFVKVHQVADKIGLTIAGLVSDAQLLTKLVRAEIKLMEIQTHRKLTVKEASNLLAGMNYSNIRRPSMVAGIVGFLIGGHDDQDGFTLYNIGIDGSIIKKDDYDSEGSGSVFALGVLESDYRPGLSTEEGIKLVQRAVNAALQRDAATGNGIDVYVINEQGTKHVLTKTIDTGLQLTR